MRRFTPLIIISLMFMLSLSGAQYTTLGGLLKGYGIGNASSITNISYSGSTYSLISIGSGHILVRDSPQYSIVTNVSTTVSILSPYLRSRYTPNDSVFSNLSNSIEAFRGTAEESIAHCLAFTGLRYTQNVQRACGDSSYCLNYSSAFGNGFLEGITNFSQTYGTFNRSYSSFLSLANGINSTNYGTYINGMYADAVNISASSAAMPHSDIFPVENVSPSQLASCPYSFTPTPWYCGSKFVGGFCPAVYLNSTKISAIEANVSSLAQLPVYNTTILAYSNSTASLGSAYIVALNRKINTTMFDAMLNRTYPIYNSTISKASFIAAHLSAPQLASSLSRLESNFTRIYSLSYNQNVSKASMTLNALIANTLSVYANASASYLPVYNLSQGNERQIAIVGLDYPQNAIPSSVSSSIRIEDLAAAELANQINSTTLSRVSANVSAVSSALNQSSHPLSIPAFVKGLDYPIIGVVFGSAPNPAAADSGAAYLAALVSFLIGLIIVIAIISIYKMGRKRGPKKPNRDKNNRGLTMVAILVLILLIIYPLITLYYANQANAFLPVSGLIARVSSSNSVATTLPKSACTDTLSASLEHEGKSLVFISAPVSQSNLSGTLVSNTISGSGSIGFGVPNGTTSMVASYSSQNASGSISIYSSQSKLANEFILTGGSESGRQSVSVSNSVQTGEWSVRYNLTSGAAISISYTINEIPANTAALSFSEALRGGMPIIEYGNESVYKGLVGYIMYVNSSMDSGSSCALSSIAG